MIAVETNGTIIPPSGIDHICVSPKAGAKMVLNHGQEIKLVYPQTGLSPEAFASMEFEEFYLQPMDGPDLEENIERTIEYCRDNPQWCLSVQLHKVVGIP